MGYMIAYVLSPVKIAFFGCQIANKQKGGLTFSTRKWYGTIHLYIEEVFLEETHRHHCRAGAPHRHGPLRLPRPAEGAAGGAFLLRNRRGHTVPSRLPDR